MSLFSKLFIYASALTLLARCQEDGVAQDGGVADDYHKDDGNAGDYVDPVQDKEKMQAVHKKIDKDGNGKISLAEILEFHKFTSKDMVTKSMSEEMETFDKDNDGKVTLTEVLRGFNTGFDKDTKAEREDLDEAKFAAADKNNDGVLEKDEFEGFISPKMNPDVLHVAAKHHVKAKDKDGDGKLDFKEYYGFDKSHKPDPQDMEEQKKVFAELDVDGDGKLSPKEFEPYESGEHFTLSAFKALLADADTDKDSHLSVEELLSHMPKLQEHEAGSHLSHWILHHEL